MSWDPSAAGFSTDFSNGDVQNDFASGNVQSEYGNSGDQSGYGQQSERPERSERPPRPEPTEEQLQHRSYNWASNRARYEFNENAVDDQGMAPRDATLEAELFEENSAEQQTSLDFSKYEKIPVRVERGTAPPPIKNVSCCILIYRKKLNLSIFFFYH
jgi:hypothetical protein